MDKKILRNDIILIGSLLLVAVIALVMVNISRNWGNKNLVATISVQSEVVQKVDLSDKEEHEYIIHGLKGDVHVHSKDGAIAVVKSNCPHQDCVKTGYVSTANKPIICAYNAVYIIIEGNSDYDIEV